MSKLLFAGCALALACTSAALAQAPEHHSHGAGMTHAGSLGEVAFDNSGAPSAQEPFLRGLALLHSFEYDEAAEAFREAQSADGKFALAFYGEALTYAHLLWGEDDPVGARAALARLGPTPKERVARAGSEREQAYAAAVEALFAEADPATRVRGFADGMRKVSSRYPKDVDAVALTALALMFADDVVPADQRRAAREEAITMAERAYALHSKHPGALHYLIHATDDPEFAPRGEAAARSYAEIAPDAEHALHMPSHIFVQLGHWDDVVASNERAWAASRADVAARGASGADVSFHVLRWLQYGYHQQGRFGDAAALIDTARHVLADVDLNDGARVDARFAVSNMVFAHAANTGEWSRSACDAIRMPEATQEPSSEREHYFQAFSLAEAAIAEVMCTGKDGTAAAALRTQAAAEGERFANMFQRVAPVLDALAAHRNGDVVRAIELLTPIANGPQQPPVGPPALLRTQELLAEALMKNGQPTEAAALYERALRLTPNRALALLGLARARSAAGQSDAAATAYRQLLANWHGADGALDVLAEVRAGAGQH